MAVRKASIAMGLTVGALLALVVAEIAAIIWVAGEIGWWTLAVLTITTLLGIYLMQREWRKAWGAVSEALRAGQLPTGKMADASLVLVGGILLTLPGLLTDALGLLLLLPFTRPFVRSALSWWAARVIKTPPGSAGPVIIKGETAQAGTLIPPSAQNDKEAADGQVIRGDLDDL